MKVRLARRYAQALFRLAQERQILHEVEAELTVVERVFTEADTQIFFGNPGVPTTNKKETIGRLFAACVSSFVQNFLCHLIDKRRTDVLPEIINCYRALVKQASNILEVRIVTALPLAKQDREQLVAQLANVTGKNIELHPQVDSKILGGLILQIGDKRIDSSVVAKLASLKRHILTSCL